MCIPQSSVRLCENSIVKNETQTVRVICGNNAGKKTRIVGAGLQVFDIFSFFRKKLLYQFAKSKLQLGENKFCTTCHELIKTTSRKFAQQIL
jgi:hypothetical protein